MCINGLPHGEGTLFRKLWAAAALADEKYHQLIVKAHMDFIEAGSQIITTNSYAVQPNYYSTAYGEDAYEGFMLEHAKVSTYTFQAFGYGFITSSYMHFFSYFLRFFVYS